MTEVSIALRRKGKHCILSYIIQKILVDKAINYLKVTNFSSQNFYLNYFSRLRGPKTANFAELIFAYIFFLYLFWTWYPYL